MSASKNKCIDELMKAVDVSLTWDEAGRILEKFGWNVERAAQALLMSSEISLPPGSLYDSTVEREFREDQKRAFGDGHDLGGCYDMNERESPLVLNFGRPTSKPGDGPIVIRAEPTHILNIEVKHLPGDGGKMYYSICSEWHVNSGLSVTDIILYPHGSPEGYNPVSHKYADGDSCLNGSVRFDHVERGRYDVRLYNNTQPNKPLCSNEQTVIVGPVANLSAVVHDGIAVRVSVSTNIPGQKGPVELQVKPRDWIGLFNAEEKNNTILYERGAYKYCSELVDSSVEMRFPRIKGKYQFRYFDNDSPVGVCCGVSDVIDYTPVDSMEALAYSTSTAKLRVRWSCFSREPNNWFWIGIFSDASSGDKAKREAWNWCSKGQRSASGEYGLLDLELPKTLADIVYSRTQRSWQLQDLELRFYVSSSELLFKVPLPDMPGEPSNTSTL